MRHHPSASQSTLGALGGDGGVSSSQDAREWSAMHGEECSLSPGQKRGNGIGLGL